LFTTALIELGAGLAFLAIHSEAVNILFGGPLLTPPSLALGRLAGAALLALTIASGLASRAPQGGAAGGVVAGMTVYNLGAVFILAAAAIGLSPAGILLWPGLALHSGMTIWCIATLLSKPAETFGTSTLNFQKLKRTKP
jgi:hypothetical protein